jgi:hypothetical protein
VLSRPPRRRDGPSQPGCEPSCGLRPFRCGLGLRGRSLAGPRRCSLALRPGASLPSRRWRGRWASEMWFPSSLPSELPGSGLSLGGTDSRWTRPPSLDAQRRGRLSTHSAFQRAGLRPLTGAGTLPQPCGRWSLRGSPWETDPMCGCAPSVRDTTPGRPAPWPQPDHEALGYAAAARPHTGMFVSDHVGEAGWEFPRANARDESNPSRPPRRRAAGEQRLSTCGLDRPSARPWWLWGVATTLHPARGTTLPTEVPRVRRGGRTRAVSRPWLGNGRPFLHRLRPPEVANS